MLECKNDHQQFYSAYSGCRLLNWGIKAISSYNVYLTIWRNLPSTLRSLDGLKSVKKVEFFKKNTITGLLRSARPFALVAKVGGAHPKKTKKKPKKSKTTKPIYQFWCSDWFFLVFLVFFGMAF